MNYLLDSNVLRAYAAGHPTLLQNLARVPKTDVAVPLIVVVEQMRGRYEAILKAEPHNLCANNKGSWRRKRSCASSQFATSLKRRPTNYKFCNSV
jgi:predicted nucleic acid-binding protein